MTKEELIENGNEAIRDALDDAIIIINSKGNALSKRRDDDEMFFSDKLDCTPDLSTIVFDDEDHANKAIENVLFPQEPEENYYSIKITKFKPEDGDEIVNIQTDDNGVEGESKTFVNGKEENADGMDVDNLLPDADGKDEKNEINDEKGSEKNDEEG